jgi:DNA-binding CsgD family transcriptional regulator
MSERKRAPTALDRVTRNYWSPRPDSPPTRRDLEVLAAVLVGTRREAAQRLGLHPATVRQHMANLCIRLQVLDRVEAARALGWLRIPPEHITGAGPRSDDDTAPVAYIRCEHGLLMAGWCWDCGRPALAQEGRG